MRRDRAARTARSRGLTRFLPKVAVVVAAVLAMSTGAAAVELAADDRPVTPSVGEATTADGATGSGLAEPTSADIGALEREEGLSAAAVLEELGGDPDVEGAATSDAAPVCSSPGEGRPIFITEDCTDPRFNDSYVFVTVNEVRELPVPHRLVLGGFRGTGARFSIVFPEADQYEGRFHQGPVHQIRPATSLELPSAEEIQLAFDSGAYLVQTNNGGNETCLAAWDALSGRCDPTVGGYRVAAASAKFSRVLAERLYGEHRPFGYVYGGSGGAYMTIAMAQNTEGVWDGFVPFVHGHPHAIPNNFSIRMHALRVLRGAGKFPEIMDAIDPGGSGDPYETLNAEEAAALREATRLGFPMRGWWDHENMAGHALPLVAAYVPLTDPTYSDDFWTEPGYLGTDPSPAGDSVRAARIQHPTRVTAASPGVPAPSADLLGVLYPSYMLAHYIVGMPPKSFVLESLPEGDLEGADLVATSGPATGKSCPLMVLAAEANLVTCGGNTDPAVIDGIETGEEVRIDNSVYLALQTYPRHQVTTPDFYGWDQYRRGGQGTPIYPQRSVHPGPIGAVNAAGSVANGEFHGKMILVQNLMDTEAFPWNGDWYHTKAREAVGCTNGQPCAELDERFRIWFTDHAMHSGNPGDHEGRTVQYRGVLDQALRDVAAWAEQDVPAPASTSYTVDDDSQVQLPASAAARRGIQPVVELTVDGGERADISVGDSVTFRATITVPPGTGEVVAADWNLFTSGYTPRSAVDDANPLSGNLIFDTVAGNATGATESSPWQAAEVEPGERVTLERTVTYDEPGTYFPALRGTSQREGDVEAAHGRVDNLDRVRVVVTDR